MIDSVMKVSFTVLAVLLSLIAAMFIAATLLPEPEPVDDQSDSQEILPFLLNQDSSFQDTGR